MNLPRLLIRVLEATEARTWDVRTDAHFPWLGYFLARRSELSPQPARSLPAPSLPNASASKVAYVCAPELLTGRGGAAKARAIVRKQRREAAAASAAVVNMEPRRAASGRR